jgi:transposase
MKRPKFSQPFRDLMPLASAEENRLLAADIAENGVLDSIEVSEDGEILSGHRRYAVDPNAPSRTIKDVKTQAEKKAYCLKRNTLRRNLDAEGRRHLQESQKAVAAELKAEGKKQREIAKLLGVAQQTVSDWLQVIHTGAGMNQDDEAASKRFASRSEVRKILEQREQGLSEREIAENTGLSQSTVHRAVAGETKGRPEITTERAGPLSSDKATTISTPPAGPLRSMRPSAKDQVLKLLRELEKELTLEDLEEITNVLQERVAFLRLKKKPKSR